MMRALCSLGFILKIVSDIDFLQEYMQRFTPVLYWGRKAYIPYTWLCGLYPGICALKQGMGGSSWKNVHHLSQLINSGKLQKYDYGSKGNMIEYGTPSPPEYDFSKITIPYAMFLPEYDELSSIKNNEEVLSRLRHDLPVHCHVIKGRGHVLIGEGQDLDWYQEAVTFLDTYFFANDPKDKEYFNKCKDLDEQVEKLKLLPKPVNLPHIEFWPSIISWIVIFSSIGLYRYIKKKGK